MKPCRRAEHTAEPCCAADCLATYITVLQLLVTDPPQAGPAFLADRTYHLVWSRLCYIVASVVVCTECIVAKRCVLEQKLQLTAYRR